MLPSPFPVFTRWRCHCGIALEAEQAGYHSIEASESFRQSSERFRYGKSGFGDFSADGRSMNDCSIPGCDAGGSWCRQTVVIRISAATITGQLSLLVGNPACVQVFFWCSDQRERIGA